MCGWENERKCTDETRKTCREENLSFALRRPLPLFKATLDCLSATGILSLWPRKTNEQGGGKRNIFWGKTGASANNKR